tara:strand:- start:502 stop:681 length:180 start_codon:yes stop_codon:yes gene_type:complete
MAEDTVEETPVAPKKAAAPTKKASPAPKPSASAPTGAWKEKGFKSAAAYERYLAKFSTE